MSSRGRRSRGRPPKVTSLSRTPQTIRKPKSMTGGDSDSRSSTPVSGVSNPHTLRPRSRLSGRNTPKETPTPKPTRVVYDDNSDEENLENECYKSSDADSDVPDADIDKDRVSEDELPGEPELEQSEVLSDWSEESYSTVGSSSRRKSFWPPRRAPSPEYIEESDIPTLDLPPSGKDLIIDGELLLKAMAIYEVLRQFRTNIRLSPFRFEDFCAALVCEDQSQLCGEIHIMLLKALMREEEAISSTFSPQDLKDSVNICFFFMDGMTWYECVRSYLDSDKSVDFKSALPALSNSDYTKVSLVDRLQILQTLVDLFISSNSVRETIINEGNIQYDDHCRNCYKLGDLLCCETCSAVYHLGCVEPPLETVPEDDWHCNVCQAHKVEGVADCISDAEKSGLLCRQEALGMDRHNRRYYFIIRRLVVESEVKVGEDKTPEVWYYSTPLQLKELLSSLDGTKWERDLVYTIKSLREEIERQMKITVNLTDDTSQNKTTVLSLNDDVIAKIREKRKKLKEEEEQKKKRIEEGGEEEVENEDNLKEEVIEEECVEMTINPETGETPAPSTSLLVEEAGDAQSNGMEEKEPEVQEVKEEEVTEEQSATKTIFVINKDGQKTMMTVKATPKPLLDGDKIIETADGRKMVTRSRTGSLTPKQFADSVVSTTASVKMTSQKPDDMLVINKDGDISRITRSKAAAISTGLTGSIPSAHYKLGADNSFKQYENQYSCNALALNKYQHNEERDRKRHLSHKFSLTPLSEFKWNGAMFGNRSAIVTTIRQTMTSLEAAIPACFLHPNWHLHRTNWAKAVNICVKPSDFAIALSLLESCMKPVLFNSVWHEALGHIQLKRTTQAERDDLKKKERDQRNQRPPEEDVEPRTWVKYTRGLHHQVFKQKGEEYRVTILPNARPCGWVWLSCTRRQKSLCQSTVGLRAVAAKLNARRMKLKAGNLEKAKLESVVQAVEREEVSVKKTEAEDEVKREADIKEEPAESDVKTEGDQKEIEADGEIAMETDVKQENIDVAKQTETPMDVEKVEEKIEKEEQTEGKPMELDDNAPRAPSGLQVGGIDNFDVCEALKKHTYYPKVSKPYSRLDQLLEKRTKQWEVEYKQKLAFEAVLTKYRSHTEKNKDSKKIEPAKEKKEEKEKENKSETYVCYSVSCRQSKEENKPHYKCYSVSCRAQRAKRKKQHSGLQDSELMRTLSIPNGDMDDDSSESDEDVDVTSTTEEPGKEKPSTSTSSVPEANSVGAMKIALQALIQGGKINFTPKLIKEIEQKMALIGETKHKVSLIKNKRGRAPKDSGSGKSYLKKGNLPPCHKFLTSAKKQSLFVIERPYLVVLARKGGHRETLGFKYECKMSNVNWPYPCPRPQFKTAWRYRTQTLKNLSAAGLQLHILWACVRWDDLAIKPPAGGSNTITTETDITTTELLMRRDVGPYQLRSEFHVRKIVVPLGVLNAQPKGNYTPQRTGLRKRKRAESPEKKEPSVTETWIPEERLELWEIKLFGEKLEKQRVALQEKISEQQKQALLQETKKKNEENAAALKSRLEEQLKAQRLALQQKRQAIEKDKIITITKPNVQPVRIITTPSSSSSGPNIVKVTPIKPAGALPTKTIQIQSKNILTKTLTGGARQITLPSSTIRLQPKSSVVTATNNAPVIQQQSALKPIAPNTAASQPAIQTTPAKPTVVTTAAPAQPTVQNLRILQNPNGQLQVTGLLPGQQILKLPDGRLQLITTPTATAQLQQQQLTKPTPPPPAPKPAIQAIQLPGGQIQLKTTEVQPQPQAIQTQKVMVSTPNGPQIMDAIKTSQGMVLSNPNNPNAPKLMLPSSAIQVASKPNTVTVASSSPTKILPQPLTPQQQKPKVVLQTPTGQQIVMRQTATVAQTSVTTSAVSTVSTPASATTTTTTPSTSAKEKYQVTPQVVQQVVRQAMMQTQDPEIQAKLQAMQKQMGGPQPKSASESRSEPRIPKKSFSQAARDDHTRMAVCKQVMKGILDKIDGESKSKTDPEHYSSKTRTTKLMITLNKQKDSLKKEMLRKRAIMEKAIQMEIECEISTVLKDTKKKRKENMSSAVSRIASEESLPKAKKKKQKIISTGNSKTFSPSQRLYCVCRTPYDESKFYIGCDLCSNWFHGACVGIPETQARYVDSFVCDECKKQQENTQEELYCLCRTPYDDSQFYIGCDTCQDWFHGTCVNVTKAQADKMDTYVCPKCRKDSPEKRTPSSSTSTYSRLILEDHHWEHLRRLIRSLRTHKMSWPFLEAVDPSVVPDYYEVIKEPVDLSTIHKRIDLGHYTRLGDLVKDVMQMFDNCRLYNPPESSFYQCAEILETYFVQRLKALQSRLNDDSASYTTD